VQSTVFQLVDIICCIAIIFPVALTIRHLKDAAQTDGKAARSMVKLQLFRQFYLIVVLYLYFTRIVVVFTSLTLPFTVDWINTVMEELATLAFYLYVGYAFRPQENSPYFKVEEEDLNNDKSVEMHQIQDSNNNNKDLRKGSGTIMD